MHTCELLVFSCIDFRFQEPLKEFLNKDYKGNYDLVCLAGSVKNFVSGGGADKETFLKQVKISKDLHHIKKVFLINHQNCGAYGAELQSGSPEEIEKHHRDLLAVREELSVFFPDLQFSLFFVQFEKERLTSVQFTRLD